MTMVIGWNINLNYFIWHMRVENSKQIICISTKSSLLLYIW